MCIGADAGCQEVPDAIAPIDMKLVALEPTRIPISLPDITMSEPIFIICISGVITCDGLGDGDGICIPGVMTCGGLGDGDGICIPGVMTCGGLEDGDGDGVGVDGVFLSCP